jgi:hypothetical protein
MATIETVLINTPICGAIVRQVARASSCPSWHRLDAA